MRSSSANKKTTDLYDHNLTAGSLTTLYAPIVSISEIEISGYACGSLQMQKYEEQCVSCQPILFHNVLHNVRQWFSVYCCREWRLHLRGEDALFGRLF